MHIYPFNNYFKLNRMYHSTAKRVSGHLCIMDTCHNSGPSFIFLVFCHYVQLPVILGPKCLQTCILRPMMKSKNETGLFLLSIPLYPSLFLVFLTGSPYNVILGYTHIVHFYTLHQSFPSPPPTSFFSPNPYQNYQIRSGLYIIQFMTRLTSLNNICSIQW